MVNRERRQALGTLTEALVRRGDASADVQRLGIALHGVPSDANRIEVAAHATRLGALGARLAVEEGVPSACDDEPTAPAASLSPGERVTLLVNRRVDHQVAAQASIARLWSAPLLADRVQIEIEAADTRRVLAKLRRCARALVAELAELEADGRAALELALGRAPSPALTAAGGERQPADGGDLVRRSR